MKIKLYQVDAFASKHFEGNPAAVCPLDAWLDDDVLQAIAAENNLSETAFFVPAAESFALRWFTPVCEVDLCGHATLATAHVLFEDMAYPRQRITFETRSGALIVERHGKQLKMDFPASQLVTCEISERWTAALGQQPVAVLAAEDYLVVFEHEEIIRAIQPDQALLGQLDLRGVIVTAPGNKFDFVSRFFAPKFGIAEDPVTGSAHCALTPYWAERLGKTTLNARQISKRGGDIGCELAGERVILSGEAIIFMEAEISLPDSLFVKK